MGADEAGAFTGVAIGSTSNPVEFALGQNYPNPFNPSTMLSFSLKTAASVQLRVYDALGREVATLVNDALPAGTFSVRFAAGSLASGVYHYRLTAGAFTETRRMIIAK